MNNQNLAIKIKDLRNRKGYSQEQLAEESKLSLRTIQRIEKGESIPRGDTLIKLTQTLGVTPDDLLEWTDIEDKGYLTLLNLGALTVMIQPMLGIIIPLVMWILKREKIKYVDDTGKKLISFQITWALTLYLVLMIASKGSYLPINFSLLNSFTVLITEFSSIGIFIIFLYIYNLISIIINIKKSQKGLKNKYAPSIPFLK
ncbi:helix-turn-helix domain-containing protein [Robertkochia marina]|uniref:Helix-turn-helix domain-containing protein n=1 Tax=Robertkochia marina TaxID=1227945 RepID=A0A4S3LZA9_9FLAO|nr:helix-turn-helix domain-containing protein [Robertkochia marina]THD67421.1 helix-turn-helix domain-containing protein [Robertkochia marina]TRZ40770.1 helix-turn-helix domain-containing protein [Robertkochia marina]